MGDGFGFNQKNINPTHVFHEAGTYSLELLVVSPNGCTQQARWEDWMEVYPMPFASFNYYPKTANIVEPILHFEDRSDDALAWEWQFNGQDISIAQHPQFHFLDTGQQQIQLVVTNLEGCTDTSVQYIDVALVTTYHLPNAFTPNSDGLNDDFIGVGYLDGVRSFELKVWNRWGEVVFATQEADQAWNGRMHNSGAVLPAGVYMYQLDYNAPRGEQVHLNGVVTLIR